MNDNKQLKREIKTPTRKGFERSKGLFPINLSRAKKETLLIDTETIGDIMKGEKAFPYDISFIKIKGNILSSQICCINKDIFDNKYLMESAFYKDKIPFYLTKLSKDKRYNKYNDKDILLKLNKYIKDNKITYFMAYNAIFDYNSINNLYEKLGVKNEFKKLRIVDIWKVVFEIMKLCPQLLKRYLAFCKKHNLITESGKNYSSNAESVKRFILQDKEFKENHTGLEDTYIEYDILLKFLWYYEKHTGKNFYYKLDTTFNHFGLTRPDKYGNHLLKVC